VTRRLRTRGAAALLAAACGVGLGIAGDAAAAPLRVEGWGSMTADFSGKELVFRDSGAVPVTSGSGATRRTVFSYYYTYGWRVPLGAAGPSGPVTRAIAARTQAGPMRAATIVGDGKGGFVLVVGGRGFAPPVIWCCNAAGIENVLESDGRATAPSVVAAALDGKRVRMVMGRRSRFQIVSVNADDEIGTTRTPPAPFPGTPSAGKIAIARGVVAWADAPGQYATRPVVKVGVPSDTLVRSVRTLRQPGQVLRVWAAKRLVVVATRTRTGVELARYDLPSPRRVPIWSGRRLGPVDLGNGVVALGVGRTVYASRAGRLRPVARAARNIPTLATDGVRLAVFQRTRVKGTRYTTVRLQRLRLR
jgi:hypothetical protein